MFTPTEHSHSTDRRSVDKWDALFASADWLLNHHAAKEAHRSQYIKRLDLKDTSVVLDLACGIGGWTSLFARTYPNCSVIGIDNSMPTLSLAKTHSADGARSNCQFIEADVHHLPFPDKHFDFVFAANCLAYFNNLPLALSEIYRVTSPSGRIVFRQFDDSLILLHPCDTALLHKVLAAASRTDNEAGYELNFFGQRLLEIGESIPRKRHHFTIDHVILEAPLTPSASGYVAENLRYLGWRAHPYLSDADRQEWRAITDPASGRSAFRDLHSFYMMADFILDLQL